MVETPTLAADVYLWGIYHHDGRKSEYSVPEKLFAKVPRWNPKKDAPPLSIARAYRIAGAVLRSDHPEWLDSESVAWTIQLKHVNSFTYPDRWFYAFQFHRFLKDEPLPQGEATVLVLMDGSVVKPKLVQGSIE